MTKGKGDVIGLDLLARFSLHEKSPFSSPVKGGRGGGESARALINQAYSHLYYKSTVSESCPAKRTSFVT